MRFYALSTEGIDRTYRALQQHQRDLRGSTGASRCLRVAQLYGHLQFRVREGREVHLVLRDLAAAWHLQPRVLREDLNDLRALGWLTYSSGIHGTRIVLNEPVLDVDTADTAPRADSDADAAPMEFVQEATTAADVAAARPRVIAKNSPEPSAKPEPSPAMNQLISQFTATYNQHKPQGWPAYKPTGTALASRLQRAIRHAGGTEGFWAVLIQALRSMPEFWRVTYPQGRSGVDCAMALLSADRKAAGLGVEFWHVFAWAAVAQRHSDGIRGNTPGVGHGVAPGTQESDLEKANRLLFWNRDHWHGRGIEAAKLDRCEKQRLAELLEAQGEGRPGTAAEQFSQPPRQH